MIEKITLKGWKSFKDATLHIDPLTILIGPNAGGKSNIVDMFLFFGKVFAAADLSKIFLDNVRGGLQYASLSDRFSLEALVRHKEEKYNYFLECTVGNSCQIISEDLSAIRQGRKESIVSAVGDGGKLKVQADKTENGPMSGAFETNRSAIALLRGIDSSGIINPVSNYFLNIFVFSPDPTKMRGYSEFSRELDSCGKNIAGFIAASEKREEIINVINDKLQILTDGFIKEFSIYQTGPTNQDAILSCRERWTERPIDARAISDGILRIIGYLAAIVSREPDSLVIIEEVENGLHPSKAGLLLGILKELGETRKVDILLTTHSPALLDAATPELLKFVTVAHRDAEGFSKLTLVEDIERLPKLLSRGKLGDASSDGSMMDAINDPGFDYEKMPNL